MIICIQNYDRYEEDLLRNRLSGIDDEFTYKIIRDDSQNSLGYRYNNIIRYASGNYLAKMDDDDFYFKNYIADMFLPFSFTNADLVGKKEMELICAISIGYPDENPKQRTRKKISEILEWCNDGK